MKTKSSLMMVALAMGVFMMCVTFTSCSTDDNPVYSDVPSVGECVVTKGMLIINNGNYYNGIDGSLTYVNFIGDSYTVQQDVYKKANGESLGGTPNDVLAYGDKIYIAGSDENTVFVLNAKTFKLIEKINTVQEMGSAEGVNPRALEAYGGKVYVSTYGGYVAVIDTGSVSVPPHYESCYKVGSAPEGMAIGGTTDADMALYVANSDYGYGNGSISKISLANGSITEIKNDKIQNPQQLAVVGDVIYVLDWGYYDENWMQQDAGVYVINGSIVSKVVPDAIGMAVAGQSIVTYNFPYGSTKATYNVYNIVYGSLDTFTPTGGTPIEYPCAIAVDPNTGQVCIASRKMDPDTGYPNYSMPGYVNVYTGKGQFVDSGSFPTGVEPHAIAFTYGVAKLQY